MLKIDCHFLEARLPPREFRIAEYPIKSIFSKDTFESIILLNLPLGLSMAHIDLFYFYHCFFN